MRTPADKEGLDGLVDPGGESTTIAMVIESCGPGVEVLAEHEGHPVAIREGSVLASAFHPELTDDPRFHAIFMAMITTAHEREEAAR